MSSRLISAEDFSAWRDNHVTESFLKGMLRWAEDRKLLWIKGSWEGAVADPLALHELRGQAFACEKFAQMSLDELENILEQERHQPD